jgi:hypothetical protein
LITKISLGLTLLACSALCAADLQPLNVKTGEWQTTTSGQMTGMPPIPEEVLNRLTPDQRAKMEAAMASRGGAKSTVSKSCLTKEKLEKGFNTGDEATKMCTRTVVTSFGGKQEMRMECARDNMKSSGTIKVETVDSETVKGSIAMTATSGDHTMNMNYSFVSKWLGPTCSETAAK